MTDQEILEWLKTFFEREMSRHLLGQDDLKFEDAPVALISAYLQFKQVEALLRVEPKL